MEGGEVVERAQPDAANGERADAPKPVQPRLGGVRERRPLRPGAPSGRDDLALEPLEVDARSPLSSSSVASQASVGGAVITAQEPSRASGCARSAAEAAAGRAAVVLLDVGDRRAAARAVGGLEAELVERGLQRRLVAGAGDRRAADGVDGGALLASARSGAAPARRCSLICTDFGSLPCSCSASILGDLAAAT